MRMHIRPVEAADFEAIAALTNQFILRTAIHFGEAPVSADELRDDWQRSRERFPYLVAEQRESGASAAASSRAPDGAAGDRGVFLGYAKAGPWRTRSAYRFTAEVGIYIAPEAQKRGVGAALYEALIESCRAAGFHALIGGITMPNDASVRLHERLGFQRIGVFPEVGFKFDRWHGVGFWQLMLQPDAAKRPSGA